MLRRAVRSMRLLGFDEPSLPHLFPVSLERMKQSYPEEPRTASAGSPRSRTPRRRPSAARSPRARRSSTPPWPARSPRAARLAGEQAFALHDTYGFPIDLTLEMAAEQGLEVDREGFKRLMQEQRDRAKADAKAKKAGHADTHVWSEFRERGATEFRAYEEPHQRGPRRRPRPRRGSGRGNRAGPARPGHPGPHAVLRRVRRPDRRRGRHHRRRAHT